MLEIHDMTKETVLINNNIKSLHVMCRQFLITYQSLNKNREIIMITFLIEQIYFCIKCLQNVTFDRQFHLQYIHYEQYGFYTFI